jgi:hypothetical protein
MAAPEGTATLEAVLDRLGTAEAEVDDIGIRPPSDAARAVSYLTPRVVLGGHVRK